MEPYTIITTVQPLLIAWVGAIAFFVTLAVIAIISRGRTWYELGCLFLLVFLALSAAGLLGASTVLDVVMIDLEIISLK